MLSEEIIRKNLEYYELIMELFGDSLSVTKRKEVEIRISMSKEILE